MCTSQMHCLFLRVKGRLLHVLTSEENEFKGFYPLNKRKAAALQLADIPFVRLRSLLSYEIKGQNLMDLNFNEIGRLYSKTIEGFKQSE